MERVRSDRAPCVVCGSVAQRHAGWFLVTENQWLDRIRVLSWHPVIARQAAMHSVCCEGHLKTLLTHWLTHANLKILATGAPPRPAAGSADFPERDAITMSVGRFVGELAVHRESFSRVWTGSAEALECIVNALVEGITDRTKSAEISHPSQAVRVLEYLVHAGSEA